MHCIVQQEWNAGIYLFNNELRNLDLIYGGGQANSLLQLPLTMTRIRTI